MDAEDLHQPRDREANAAYGNHRHDAVANPPSPRVSVVDTGIGTVANINNAYPWGWWVGYGIMTMIAIGGVGFPIPALVEIFGVHRYHPFLRPAVLMAFLCYASAITMLMVELGRPWMVWMVLVSWAPTSALYEVGWC